MLSTGTGVHRMLDNRRRVHHAAQSVTIRPGTRSNSSVFANPSRSRFGLRRRMPKLEKRTIVRTRAAAELVQAAIRDKSSIVRIVGADALIDDRSQFAEDEAAFIALLTQDRSPAIRSRADYLLLHPVSPS